ncbi:5-methyltetrahydropteroyltriglutamate--homocysteine methyltransferase, partial [Staphylococcus saprophyticus]
FDKDAYAVLGLITSKTPELEDKELIKQRIKEAQQYISLDQIFLSPQFGFASTEEGNQLTEEEQWTKLKYVVELSNELLGSAN